ncbi:hypothetical protein ANTRET_LOCUS10098 [Anthophora retusa]
MNTKECFLVKKMHSATTKLSVHRVNHTAGSTKPAIQQHLPNQPIWNQHTPPPNQWKAPKSTRRNHIQRM